MLWCEHGMFLTWGGEQTYRPLRITLYALALGWCFMGVAIIADVFMVAIETITSRKTRKYIESKKRYVTTAVWNDTVANLTLMALGSSAPEIMINVIEIFRDDFFIGPEGVTPLGPSTIVGSAAFNLFVIIAVCISVIPSGETRHIKEVPVYVLTAIFSIFAYAWLIIILTMHTPHVVEPWEGIVTFLMFPLLVVLAYFADTSPLFHAGHSGNMSFVADMTKEELAELEAMIRKEHGQAQELSEEIMAKFVQIYCGDLEKSRARYRISATRSLFGCKRVKLDAITHRLSNLGSNKVAPEEMTAVLPDEPAVKSSASLFSVHTSQSLPPPSDGIRIEFSEMKKAVMENAGHVRAVVQRRGMLEMSCSVQYKTRDGTAKAPTDYKEAEGTLVFGPHEKSKPIHVEIVDDFSYEENEEFYIDLSNPCVLAAPQEDVSTSAPAEAEAEASAPSSPCRDQARWASGECAVVLGNTSTTTIVIVDDDMPGVIAFQKEEQCEAERVGDYEVVVVVERKNGCTGKVSCNYRIEDGSAIAGMDFEAQEGCLEFANQQMEKTIRVKMKARGRYERCEFFRVILEGPLTGGAKFDPETDGGPDTCILTIRITGDQQAKHRVDRLMSVMESQWKRSRVGGASWRDQFVEALYVNGGEAESQESASWMDLAMHVITVPWKVLFAFCPPADYCGGWMSFYVALGFIGFVTALISDLANLLGCCIGMCNAITAITIVAFGTSLPDTMASKTAATQDQYADASIVNVTGSNSVNVFLGLGLPWMIASIKWKLTGRNEEWDRRYAMDEDLAADVRSGPGMFVVKAGDLGFSVGVFAVGAFVCLCVLAVRRQYLGGELGGARVPKVLTATLLVLIWCAYIVLSSWKAMEGYCSR